MFLFTEMSRAYGNVRTLILLQKKLEFFRDMMKRLRKSYKGTGTLNSRLMCILWLFHTTGLGLELGLGF